MKTHPPMLVNLFLTAAVSTAAVAPPPAEAQTAPQPLVAQFKATAINLERIGGETITIDVRRWSTDADRDKLLAAFGEKGTPEATELAQKTDPAGYIWRSGSGLGQFVRFAFQATLPDGGQRILLVTDQDLSEWNRRPGPASAQAAQPLTVVELRLPAKGTGEGKISLTSNIAPDKTARMLALDNYDAAPVVLKGVTRGEIRR